MNRNFKLFKETASMLGLVLVFFSGQLFAQKGQSEGKGKGDILQPIVGGGDTDITLIPWQVLLEGSNCGGSILSENWVITAAHCSPQIGDELRFGITSIINDVGEKRTIAEVVIHPQWDGVLENGYDIALLRLNEPLVFTDKIQPIRYAMPQDVQAGRVDLCIQGLVSGWGQLDEDAPTPVSDVLQSVTVPIVSNVLADDAYASLTPTDELEPGFLLDHQLVAGDFAAQGCSSADGNGGEDACQGDSGGPFAVPNPKGGYILAGIISWGIGCGRSNLPGIYTKVSAFSDFIEDVTNVSNNKYPGLIISEVVHGTNAGGNPRYIEIYNASTTETYNLNDIIIRVYNDGTLLPMDLSIPDGNSLLPGTAFVIAGPEAWQTSWGGAFLSKTPDLTSDIINGNGNDAYILYDNNAGFVLDAYGRIGEDGTGAFWNYQDARAIRNKWITNGNNGDFQESNIGEWSISAYENSAADPGTHEAVQPEIDAAILSVTAPNPGDEVYSCNTDYSISPTVKIKNQGSESISQVVLEFFNGTQNVNETFNLGVPLAPNEIVPLNSTLMIDYGAAGKDYELSVAIRTINGGEDGNPLDNTKNIRFDMIQGYTATFEITFDENPEHNAWSILQKEDTVYSGNNGDFYTTNVPGTSLQEKVCLPAGFYEFQFYDGTFNPLGFIPFDGFESPGNFKYTINTPDIGDVEIANVSGKFEGVQSFRFKLPYENVLDLALASPVDGITTNVCNDSQSLNIEVLNNNSLPVNSYKLSYGIVGEPLQVFERTSLALMAGQSDRVDLDFLLKEGENRYIIEIIEVNGMPGDENIDNNQISGNYDIDLNNGLTSVNIDINTDFFPQETSWQLLDSKDNVVDEVVVGSYQGNEPFITTHDNCLAEGCYTFVLRDTGGDAGPTAFLTDKEGNELLMLSDSPWDSEVQGDFCLLAVPGSLVATTRGLDEIELSWSNTSALGTDFVIESALNRKGPWTKIDTVTITTTTYQHEGLQEATVYFYRVRTLDIPNSTASSATVIASAVTDSTPISTPSGLNALTANFYQINLDWEDNSDNETGFRVERALASEGPWELAADLPADATTFVDDGLEESTKYFFRVSATNASTSSEFSNVADAVTTSAPTIGPPSELSAEVISFREIRVSWKNSADDASGIKLERSLSSDGPWEEVIGLVNKETNYIDTDLTGSTTYFYRIKAFQTFSNPLIIIESEYSEIVETMTISGFDQDRTLVLTTIYPNPVSEGGTVTVAWDREQWKDDFLMSLYDTKGARYFAQRININKEKTTVNISSLPNGMYLLRLNNKKNTVLKKLIIE